jgi:hypothetical protein
VQSSVGIVSAKSAKPHAPPKRILRSSRKAIVKERARSGCILFANLRIPCVTQDVCCCRFTTSTIERMYCNGFSFVVTMREMMSSRLS